MFRFENIAKHIIPQTCSACRTYMMLQYNWYSIELFPSIVLILLPSIKIINSEAHYVKLLNKVQDKALQ